jgi:hypothetical protein
MYTIVTATVFHVRNPEIKTHALSQLQPKSTSQAMRSTLLALNIVTNSTFTLADHMILAAQPELQIETMFCCDQSASVSIQLK